jgi:hypothetical protein
MCVPTHTLDGSGGDVLAGIRSHGTLRVRASWSLSQEVDPLTHSGVVTPILLASYRSSPCFTGANVTSGLDAVVRCSTEHCLAL